MAWPRPEYSKNRVRAAGKRIVAGYEADGCFLWGLGIPSEEYLILENWRTSHGAVLNTAQAWLRRLDKAQRPVVGQRLKRHNTVLDKLVTGRSRDLSTMHDIAGVRAIFRTVDDLYEFREQMRLSKASHKITHDPMKFDYISNPKPTGYRGIHDVMERHVSSPDGAPWNGLKFEVQLRTAVQHAWATAVEIYDDTRAARFKFQSDEGPAYRQFLIVSELFSRVHEGRSGCVPNISDEALVEEFSALEAETRAVTMMHGLQVATKHRALRKNSILQRTVSGELRIYNFPSMPAALRAVSDIEARSETLNAVLVGSKTPNHIKDAFRNYFEDSSAFVELLDAAIFAIRGGEVKNLWHRRTA